jgi:hypothetical protein
MAYFIYFREESKYKIDPQFFSEQLRDKWARGRFEDPNQFGIAGLSVSCWIEINGEDELVQLWDFDCISIDNPLTVESTAQFALWCRSIIPARYKLFLAHDSWGEEEIELTTDLMQAALADTLGKQ